MFHKLIVPVDLAHTSRLTKALEAAARLAHQDGAELCLVGVTTPTPSAIARTPEEFGQKLAAFAASEAEARGIPVTHHVLVSHDPSVQMDKELEKLVAEMGADLVVMATHLPGASDYIWHGHGAHMAAHSTASVMLVRGE